MINKPTKKRGRPPGKANKASAAREARIASTGLTPLEVMVSAYRYTYDQAAKAEDRAVNARNPTDRKLHVDEALTLYASASSLAADAAQYVHPKLSAITATGEIRVKLPSASEVVAALKAVDAEI